MKYEKIRGKSISECLMKIRSKYGTSAIVITQREVREGGVLGSGLLSKKMYEVDFMVKEPDYKRSGAGSRAIKRSYVMDESPTEPLKEIQSRKEESEVFQKLIEHRYDRIASRETEPGRGTTGYKKESPKSLDHSKISSGTDSGKIQSKQAEENQGFKVVQPEYSPEELVALLRPMDEDEPFHFSNRTLEGESLDVPPPDFQYIKKEINTKSADHERFEASDGESGLDEDDSRQHSTGKWERETEKNHIQDPAIKVFHKIRKKMLGAQLSAEFADSMMNWLENNLSPVEREKYSRVQEKAIESLARVIRTTPDIAPPRGQCRAVMLMGPHGSGKTTSIGKLAARYQLAEKREVSIYSLDQYRLGAVQQLKSFAQAIEVPFYAPVTPEEFREQMDRDGAEIMLIDTPGIGPSELQRMRDLKKYIDICPVELEKHLVLGADLNPALLDRILNAFDFPGFEKIILTRLDETEFIGAFIESADKLNRPFSYLMNGQYPAGNIMESDPLEIAKMILHE